MAKVCGGSGVGGLWVVQQRNQDTNAGKVQFSVVSGKLGRRVRAGEGEMRLIVLSSRWHDSCERKSATA